MEVGADIISTASTSCVIGKEILIKANIHYVARLSATLKREDPFGAFLVICNSSTKSGLEVSIHPVVEAKDQKRGDSVRGM